MNMSMSLNLIEIALESVEKIMLSFLKTHFEKSHYYIGTF